MKLQVASKFNPCEHPDINISWDHGLFRVVFEAMASPCTLLLELEQEKYAIAKAIAQLAAIECWRIEYKYSRYISGNYLKSLHLNPGQWVKLDDETFRLFSFAEQAWHLSDGMFDISAGILRRAWHFTPESKIPKQSQIDCLLGNIGWEKASLDQIKGIKLPHSMELDLGGIGKEYAVDSVLQLVNQHYKHIPTLVNFGGDIACNQSRADNQPWLVGIESPTGLNSQASLSLSCGALATSGDSKRFIQHKGKRYSHVLNPKTGWPVSNPPRSITVAAPTCTQAGLLATLGLLQGSNAENYVKDTGFKYWIYHG